MGAPFLFILPLMIGTYIRGADHAKMLAGAVIWLIFDLPLAWLLGPAMVGLLLAIHSKPVGTDYFFGDCGRGLLGVAIGASITPEHIDWMLTTPTWPRLTHLCRARWRCWLPVALPFL